MVYSGSISYDYEIALEDKARVEQENELLKRKLRQIYGRAKAITMTGDIDREDQLLYELAQGEDD